MHLHHMIIVVTCQLLILFGLIHADWGQDYLNCDYERPNGRDPPSRKCPRACRKDYDCRRYNPNHECVCDGECGKSCVDPNHLCYPEPRNITNGRVTLNPYNKFGAVAEYKCNDGYTLNGVFSRVCQGDQTWAGEPPICELNHNIFNEGFCPPVPTVHNARHNGRHGQSRFEIGSSVTFECLPGFKEQASDVVKTAWCVGGGTWMGPNIQCISKAPGCEKPPDIHHGYAILMADNKPGSRASYTCVPGYFLAGERQRVCQNDGSWSGLEPSCKKVVCGPPPELENAVHDARSGQISFGGGTQLIYSCQFGYYREGTPRAICNGKHGQWDGPNMSCRARDCDAPPEIENGRREDGYRFTYPTKIAYYCNEGYDMEGKNYMTCEANGQWKGQLPTCRPIHCPEIGPPTQGTMAGFGTEYHTTIHFMCSVGFKLIGSAERTCQADRKWSGKTATCEEIDCGFLGDLHNGYIEQVKSTVGGIAFFRCSPYTKFIGKEVSSTCLENGQWSDPIPLCLGRCEVPEIQDGSIENVRSPSVWVDHDTVVKPLCTDGRVLNDSRTVKCQNGTWTVIPKCVPAPCGTTPPTLENGHRVFFGLSHGSRARYYCLAGYKLVNEVTMKYMTCDHGKWHGVKPRCVENYCPKPKRPENGVIYKLGSQGNGKFEFHDFITIIKHGERLVYECNRNYKIVGPRGAACVHGQWSPSNPPKCVRSRHPVFTKLWKPHEERGSGYMYY